MSDAAVSYRPEPQVADDFDFIARRMKDLHAPAAYDVGKSDDDAAYHGPIVEDVADIAQRLHMLEAAKAPPGASPSDRGADQPKSAEGHDDWWCC